MNPRIGGLRLPADLVEKLRAEAASEERSLTRQLTVILRERYEEKK